MTPERIAEFEKRMHEEDANCGLAREILDALEAAQAEIADLKRGGVVVPDITDDRVLGEGRVAVDRELLTRLSDWFAWCGIGGEVIAVFRREIDALRAQPTKEPTT